MVAARSGAVRNNGTGATWFMLLEEGERAVRWDAEWNEYEEVEGNLLDAWVAERKLYESVSPKYFGSQGQQWGESSRR